MSASTDISDLSSLHPGERRTLPSWALCALGVVLIGVWGAVIWAAPRTTVTPELRMAAAFLHVAAVLVGFGAVLTVDWIALMWLLGKRKLGDLVDTANAVHNMVWLGLSGLVLSGLLLHPDVSSRWVQAKLALVLVVVLNGLHAYALGNRLETHRAGPVPRSLLVRSALTGAVSQVGWWGCTLIGFANSYR